jgi:cation transporter-like permease
MDDATKLRNHALHSLIFLFVAQAVIAVCAWLLAHVEAHHRDVANLGLYFIVAGTSVVLLDQWIWPPSAGDLLALIIASRDRSIVFCR